MRAFLVRALGVSTAALATACAAPPAEPAGASADTLSLEDLPVAITTPVAATFAQVLDHAAAEGPDPSPADDVVS